MDMLTDARFWAQVTGDSRRTVVCSPENESRLKGYVAARDLCGLVTVVVSPYVRDDQLIVLDEQGMQARLRQQLQRWRP